MAIGYPFLALDGIVQCVDYQAVVSNAVSHAVRFFQGADRPPRILFSDNAYKKEPI